jgi:hypothetical protein
MIAATMKTSTGAGLFSIFRFLAAAFLAALLASAAYTVWTHPFWRPAPQILGVGSAFEGNAQLPQPEIDGALQAGRQAVATKNLAGNRFATVATVSGWIAFLLTSLITLAAGYHGIASAGDTGGVDAATVMKGRSVRFARSVGLLAAGAAVCTALGGRAAGDAERYYKQADDLQRRVTVGRKSIIDAKTAEEAHAALDQLRSEIAR